METLKSTFPNSQIEIEKLDVNYGTSIKLSGSNLKMKGFEAARFKARASLLSFITGAGYIEVLLQDSVLDISGRFKSVSKREIQIPSYVVNSSGSARFEGLKVVYSHHKPAYEVDRLIVKNLGLRSVAAFEIKTKASLIKGLSSDNYVFGTIDLNHYLEKKILPIKAEVKVNSINWRGNKNALSTVTASTDIQLNESGYLKGNIQLKHQGSTAKLQGDFKEGKLNISKFEAEIMGEDFNPLFIKGNLPRQPKLSKLNLSGSLFWSENNFKPVVKGLLSTWNIKLFDETVGVSGEVAFENKGFKTDLKTGSGGGKQEIICQSRLDFDEEALHKAISDFNCDLKLVEGEIENFQLKKLLLSLKDEEGHFIRLPKGKVNLVSEDALFRRHPVSGKLSLNVSNVDLALKGELKSDQELVVKIDERIKVYEDELKRKGSLIVSGTDISEVARFLKIDNPLVKKTKSFTTTLEYEQTLFAKAGKEDNKKVYIKHKGKGLGLNGDFLVGKMESVKKELEKWDLWDSVKEDINQKSFFDTFLLEARRAGDVYLINELNLTRGNKKIKGKGIFKEVRDTYLGNLDLKILKGKRKPISVFLIKDLKGFRLDRKKILKQF